MAIIEVARIDKPAHSRTAQFAATKAVAARTAACLLARVPAAADPWSTHALVLGACLLVSACTRPQHLDSAAPRVVTQAPALVPDLDAEGELAARDDCPFAAETYNGYQDDDGCPDAPPARACPYSVGPLVHFEPARSVAVTTIDRRTLDMIAEALASGHALEIRGHTSRDEFTDPDDGLRLSERRASRVRTYLLGKRNFAADRLVLRAMGDTSPNPCGSDADPARDRRVDFVLVAPP